MQLVEQSHISLIPSLGWFFLYVLASAVPTDIAAGQNCVYAVWRGSSPWMDEYTKLIK